MNLTAEERQSTVWLKIKEHLQSRLGSHRILNDNVMLTEIETARLRGRVQELKDLLKIDNPAA